MGLGLGCAASPPSAPCDSAPPDSAPPGRQPAATVEPAPIESPSERFAIVPYQTHGHRSVNVTVAGQALPFLFDTGGGLTFVSPDVARRAGCTPHGQLVGYRMRGDAVRFPRCDAVGLEVDGVTIAPGTVGVFDLGKLLPPDWPLLGGMLTLSSFEDRTVILELAKGQVETSSAPLPATASAPLNVVRQASGYSIVVLVPVKTATGTLWFELDSGSSAPLILAPHAAKMLGIDVVAAKKGDPPPAIAEVSVDLPGVGTVKTSAKVMDIIYDGNIGAPFMERFRWTLDLARERVTIAPAE
jgi:Aspartyl protease